MRLTYGNQTARVGQKRGTALGINIAADKEEWKYRTGGFTGEKERPASLKSLKVIYHPLSQKGYVNAKADL